MEIELKDYIVPERVCFVQADNKKSALGSLCRLISENGYEGDIRVLIDSIWKREALMSTGLGLGIAVPHVRLEDVSSPLIAIGVRPEGIPDYASIDNQPVCIVVMIVAGKAQHALHLSILAKIVSLLKNEDFRDQVLKQKDRQKIADLFTGQTA